MYVNNQTLRHKDSQKLASLYPSKDSSDLYWGDENCEGKSKFIDEDGIVFYDSLDNWVHIEDWDGEPVTETLRNGRPSPSLKQYLVSDSERKAKMNQHFQDRVESVLSSLDEKGFVKDFQRNGSCGWKFFTHFLDAVKAVTVAKGSYGGSLYLFRHNSKVFYIEPLDPRGVYLFDTEKLLDLLKK